MILMVACVGTLEGAPAPHEELVQAGVKAGAKSPFEVVPEAEEADEQVDEESTPIGTKAALAKMDFDMVLQNAEEEKFNEVAKSNRQRQRHKEEAIDRVGELRDRLLHGPPAPARETTNKAGTKKPLKDRSPAIKKTLKKDLGVKGPISSAGLLAEALTKLGAPVVPSAKEVVESNKKTKAVAKASKGKTAEHPKPAQVLPIEGAGSKDYLHSAAPLIARLSAAQSVADVSKNNGLKFKFSVENAGETHLKVLKWETPFEGLLANMFDVRDQEGKKAKYHGPDARRAPPYMATDDDFISIPPKQTKEVEVDLASMYVFNGDGDYFFRIAQPPDGHVHYREVMDTVVKVRVVNTKKQASLVLLQRQSRHVAKQTRLKAQEMGLLQTHRTFKNCDASQQAALKRWEEDAKKWVEAAEKCTTTNNCAANVKLWFGQASQSEYAFSVTKSLKNMLKHWDMSDYDCNGSRCSDGTFAYVYPDDTTQEVFMCPFTFTYNVASEKRQTVVHELAHYNHIGINEITEGVVGERDLSYGEKNCQELAQNDPTQAMNNADNIGYFSRDIGTNSDPSCVDKYASCGAWVQTYDCDKQYKISADAGPEYLRDFCSKSCKKCGATTLATTTPAPAATTTTPSTTPPPSTTRRTGEGETAQHSAAPTRARPGVLLAACTTLLVAMAGVLVF